MKSPLALLLLFALSGCGVGSDDPDEKSEGRDERKSRRTLEKKYADVAEDFAAAVVAKDYDRAYGHMSSWYRKEIGPSEYRKSITRYRDHVQGTVTSRVRASDDPPEEVQKQATTELFVGDRKVRALIREEFIIDFRVSGDNEGWALVGWLIEEDGKVRILNYYQDD